MDQSGVEEPDETWETVRGRQRNLTIRPNPQLAVGLSIGCFAGAGYGLAVGVGTIVSGSRNTAVIAPSLTSRPFAHDGPMVGAFCGVIAGGGFATGIGSHLGYRWDVFDEWYQAAAIAIARSISQFSKRIQTHFRVPHDQFTLSSGRFVQIGLAQPRRRLW